MWATGTLAQLRRCLKEKRKIWGKNFQKICSRGLQAPGHNLVVPKKDKIRGKLKN